MSGRTFCSMYAELDVASSRPLLRQEKGCEGPAPSCAALSQMTPTPASSSPAQTEPRLWILGRATGSKNGGRRPRQGPTRQSGQAQTKSSDLQPHTLPCAMPPLPPAGTPARTASGEAYGAFRAMDGTQRAGAAVPVAFSMGHRASNPHERGQMKMLLVERDVYAKEMNKLWQRLCRAEERASAERTLRQELARDCCDMALAREAGAEEVRRLQVMQSELTSRANVYLLFAKRVMKCLTAARSREGDALPAQSSSAAANVIDAAPRPTTSPAGAVRRVRHVRLHRPLSPSDPQRVPQDPDGRTESAPAQRPLTGHVRDSELLHALHAAEDRISYLEAQQRGNRAGGATGQAHSAAAVRTPAVPFAPKPTCAMDGLSGEVAGHDAMASYSPTIPKLTVLPPE